jgi:ParB-like chromosome segregation protein Spo0J
MVYLDVASPQSLRNAEVDDHADAARHSENPPREVVTVPVSSLQRGESPRLNGENKAHITQLAEAESLLPPVLVDRRSMQIIDGMHRLRAALLKGQETIDVVFFDGSTADAFLRAVEANVTHGLPLSHADRRAAAARIIASHPQMSDRALAESVGLAARTVATIRRRSTDSLPQLNARVGRDGRTRPLSNSEGRLRAAEQMARNPMASLREVAQNAGVSPATALDVRKRLERGEAPAPCRPSAARGYENAAGAGQAAMAGVRRVVRVMPPTAATVLEKLARDPSLRDKERGRRLLGLLHNNAVGAQEWSGLAAVVPPHCADLVVQLARHQAQMWLKFAQEVNRGPGDRPLPQLAGAWREVSAHPDGGVSARAGDT